MENPTLAQLRARYPAAFANGAAAVGPSLTQTRSTLSSPVYNRAVVTDDSPLACDIQRAPQSGEHWVLDNAGFTGKITTRVPMAGNLMSPVSGLFLVEKDRFPVESLTQASSGDGWDARARGIALPVQASIVPLINGGWAYTIFYNGMIGRTIPEGWTLRAIVNVNPGDAAPGPGASSFGELFGVIAREQNYGATA